MIALGHVASGLFTNSRELGDALLAASATSGDRCWELPVWPEYEEALKSNFADVANVGGRAAGSVTAAMFLSRFARERTLGAPRYRGHRVGRRKEQGSDRPAGAASRPVPHRPGRVIAGSG